MLFSTKAAAAIRDIMENGVHGSAATTTTIATTATATTTTGVTTTTSDARADSLIVMREQRIAERRASKFLINKTVDCDLKYIKLISLPKH